MLSARLRDSPRLGRIARCKVKKIRSSIGFCTDGRHGEDLLIGGIPGQITWCACVRRKRRRWCRTIRHCCRRRHEPRRSLGLNSADMVVNRNLSLWMGKIRCLELLVPLQPKQKPAIQDAANLPKRVLELGSHFGIAHINSRNPRSLVVLFR